jgi:hypothetical protein
VQTVERVAKQQTGPQIPPPSPRSLTRWPLYSAMYTVVAPVLLSTATPAGLFTVAVSADPPFPVLEHVPAPANSRTMPAGVMRVTRQP